MRSKEELINENAELWDRVHELENDVKFWKAETKAMKDELDMALEEMESIIEDYLRWR